MCLGFLCLIFKMAAACPKYFQLLFCAPVDRTSRILICDMTGSTQRDVDEKGAGKDHCNFTNTGTCPCRPIHHASVSDTYIWRLSREWWVVYCLQMANTFACRSLIDVGRNMEVLFNLLGWKKLWLEESCSKVYLYAMMDVSVAGNFLQRWMCPLQEISCKGGSVRCRKFLATMRVSASVNFGENTSKYISKF